jgi:hypothetical protein
MMFANRLPPPQQQQYYGNAQDGGGYDDYNQGGEEEEYTEEEYGDGFCMDDMGVSCRLNAIETVICSSTNATCRRSAHWPIALVMD